MIFLDLSRRSRGGRARQRAIDSPKVREVRGKGLLIGIELHAEAGDAHHHCELLREEGIIRKETVKYVIRFAPARGPDCNTHIKWVLDSTGWEVNLPPTMVGADAPLNCPR